MAGQCNIKVRVTPEEADRMVSCLTDFLNGKYLSVGTVARLVFDDKGYFDKMEII